MDKKKIAILSTTWANEILYQYISGIQASLKDLNVDYYFFGSSASRGQDPAYMQGELNIYSLPDYKDFDAVCIFANSLNYPEVIENTCKACDEAGVPVFFCGHNDGTHYFVGVDNYIGMHELTDHIVNHHHAKNVMYIGGDKDNQDSNVRKQAVIDVLQENGLDLPESRICYSNWTPYHAVVFLDEYLKAGNPMPDAIVCANDSLAMCICQEVLDHGRRVPEDVIVTGFDNETYAQFYDPSISSVDQHFDRIGQTTGQMFLDLLDGKPVPQASQIACEFIPSESCGCTSAKNFDAIRRSIGKNSYLNMVNNSTFDMKLSTMERVVSLRKTFWDLSEAIRFINGNDREYEGSSYQFVMDPVFEKTLYDEDASLRTFGYPEEMLAIFSKEKGVCKTNYTFKSCQLIPDYTPTEESRSFIFLPMHENGAMMGYIVFGDNIHRLKDTRMMRRYVERVNIILSKFHKDLRMEELNKRLRVMNETDVLTQSKNRTAYKNRELEIQRSIDAGGAEPFALVVFDVNNLKQINDFQGHEMGDAYIKACCNFLVMSFPGAKVYRVGGDEFVAILTGQTYERRLDYLKNMRDQMELFAKSVLPVEQKISIASGMSRFDPAADHSVQDVFNRADAEMYENKRAMKMLKEPT